MANPYEELPYLCRSIEWTAPERLALTALLHGGPRQDLDRYRVLELGCGDGRNLLALAFYRRQGEFVGVDGAASQIRTAESRQRELGITNLHFIHADFTRAGEQLQGRFDFIIAHGIFSWVPEPVRDALFSLCRDRLKPGGLLYLNYNTKPGWNVRGMVREFLLAQTAGEAALGRRTQQAQQAAAGMAAGLEQEQHPFSRLLANEFRFVCDSDPSYVAHEFLATDNHAYWRSEFLALARQQDLHYVADADFNYATGRIAANLPQQLQQQHLTGRNPDDTLDLLCYRQLHTPLLCRGPFTPALADSTEFSRLRIASCLQPVSPQQPLWFQHPSGYQVEANDPDFAAALRALGPLWPRSAPLPTLFSDPAAAREDLELLHRNGLIELRLAGAPEPDATPNLLNRLERQWGDTCTSANHFRVEAAPVSRQEEARACGR